mmetsp:Transcript_42979/g.106000  ORF Transcript_42979/g.106000 Transcript_42979/m.106000 type:complete len:338 (-) Transcript_42979:246-1259(-)
MVPPRRLSSSSIRLPISESDAPSTMAASVSPSCSESMRSTWLRISPSCDSERRSSSVRLRALPSELSAFARHDSACCTFCTFCASCVCASSSCVLMCASDASASRSLSLSCSLSEALSASLSRSCRVSLSEKVWTASVYFCSWLTSFCISASCRSCVRSEIWRPVRSRLGAGPPDSSAAAARSSSRVRPFSTRERNEFMCCGVTGLGGFCNSSAGGDTAAVVEASDSSAPEADAAHLASTAFSRSCSFSPSCSLTLSSALLRWTMCFMSERSCRSLDSATVVRCRSSPSSRSTLAKRSISATFCELSSSQRDRSLRFISLGLGKEVPRPAKPSDGSG